MVKDMQLKMRISKSEKELYSAEAKKRGLTTSNLVRYSIKRENNLTKKKEGRN